MLNELITNITTNEYLAAIIYFIFFFIILRVSIFILEKIILKLTIKTKTDLDDLILARLSKPLTFIALLFGLKASVNQISTLENTIGIVQEILSTILILVIMYLVYAIFDLSFTRVWNRFARKTKAKSNEAILNLTNGTIKVILIIFTIIYVLNFWGIEIGPLLAGLGIGGIAIAFALQSSLANIFGGISIILDKTVQVGDVVNLEGNTSGRILSIGLRSTRVKTFDNEIVIVPNSKLANGNIHNVAQPEPKVRVVIPFGVAYGSKIDQVKKIILTEIKKIKGYVNEPMASVKFLEMGDSSLKFKAYFFVETFENRLSAIDEANTRIYNALNKAKIEIPFPQMDVNVKK